MSPHQTLLITILGFLQLAFVFELIRRQMLRERYALLWLCIAVVFLTIPLLYDFYAAAGRFVGIMAPTSVFFLLAILGLILLSIQASLAASSAYTHRKILTQQLALLENRVQMLERAVKDGLPGDKTENRS